MLLPAQRNIQREREIGSSALKLIWIGKLGGREEVVFSSSFSYWKGAGQRQSWDGGTTRFSQSPQWWLWNLASESKSEGNGLSRRGLQGTFSESQYLVRQRDASGALLAAFHLNRVLIRFVLLKQNSHTQTHPTTTTTTQGITLLLSLAEPDFSFFSK